MSQKLIAKTSRHRNVSCREVSFSLYPKHFLKYSRKGLRCLYHNYFHVSHLRHRSISTPTTMRSRQRSGTRHPDGNTAPRRIPRATAIEHITHMLPLFRHTTIHRPSDVFITSYSKSEISVMLYLSKSVKSSFVAD